MFEYLRRRMRRLEAEAAEATRHRSRHTDEEQPWNVNILTYNRDIQSRDKAIGDLKIELASAQLKANEGFRMFRAENDALAAERDAAVLALEQIKLTVPRQPFDVRCADALADEVAALIIRKVIDARAPAADALLDYRSPPQTPRAERLADADLRIDLANYGRDRWCDIAVRNEESTVERIARWLRGYGREPVDADLAAQGILDGKWKIQP